MLTIYKTTEQGLQGLDDVARDCWIHVVIKFLTAVTIVITAPSLLSAFYGMNVSLPLQEWRFAAPPIFLVSLGVALLVTRVFVRRDWM